MPTYSGVETLEGLAQINWLTVIIVKSIDAALGAADYSAIRVCSTKECPDFSADRSDIVGLSVRRQRSFFELAGLSRNGRCWILGFWHEVQ